MLLWLTLLVLQVAAIILAAGQSRRMGAFKPLLPFGKKTVIEANVDYLRKAGIERIVAVLGHRSDDVREQLSESSVRFTINLDPTSEMSASIAAGIRELPTSIKATLIALVDHPAIPARVVSTLVAEWQSGARLVVPTWNGRGGHPVLVDLGFRDQLMSLDPNQGLKALFDTHRGEVRRVDVDSPYIARDMDTWDDYRALYEEVFGGPPSQPDKR